MSLMATPKPFQITVSLPTLQPIAPTRRDWIYKEDKNLGYRYFKTDEVEGEENDLYRFSETANALLRLVNPAREVTAEEIEKSGGFLRGARIKENLEPKEIEKFLNSYGQIGRADYSRREKFSRAFTPDGGEMTAQQFASICGIHPNYLANIEKERKTKPDQWRKRIIRLHWGTEIPFDWIEKDLFDLARTVRILSALEKDYIGDKPFFYLENKWGKARNRFLIASERVAVPLGKDENYKPQDRDLWTVSERILSAEWENFANNLNRFVSPVTRLVFATDSRERIARDNVGIETWLICSIVQTRAKFAEKRCANEKCQRQFFNERSHKRFCSTACESTVRTRRFRAKQKNSSGKSQKKKKAKGKKTNAKT